MLLTCNMFRSPIVTIFREVFYEGYMIKTSNPMYKYTLLGFKYVVLNCFKFT